MVVSTGLVRRLDQLGRVVLPMELRRIWDIRPKDALEIYVDQDRIVLKRYEPGCVFCNTVDNTFRFKGHHICSSCKEELQKAVLQKA
ncbi:MAG: AbrB/MazE/SpoVT family DNA-binding domain-containing protein [Alicyclobacillaceae bacterium]|nr:AbrB/MazE/SpoVT family DNA-binding domain-containing protein [Alicyclobacillaceae bacterium]